MSKGTINNLTKIAEISTLLPGDSLKFLIKSAKFPPIKSKPIGIAHPPSNVTISHIKDGSITCPPTSLTITASIMEIIGGFTKRINLN